ncbi:hypothetical protein BAS09_18255 [Elizabethkingia ursingii]|uniref:hypothetical protein n=1 Tax=Elizabethkingia ursingii TaxID=1756150 RepID=UPI000999C0A5|nr:hypothetical protein [Elizabethkingia ursingii]OPC06980.1 hypothetical protein BAS09_18255 [Elizabethkingia ursingii]
MDPITILAENIRKENQKNWFSFLIVQKALVEKYFDWINLHINKDSKSLEGHGILKIGEKFYSIRLTYSPFYLFRYDRIYIDDKSIKYNDDIHLYKDLSLCLYHPVVDQSFRVKMPLYEIIPWISEWIIHYVQWQKYGVWLGKEIKHQRI